MNLILKKLAFLCCMITVFICMVPLTSHAEEMPPEPGAVMNVTLDDLAGKKAGVLSGTPQDQMVLNNIKDSEVYYYNAFSDLALALDKGKIDYFINSTIGYRIMRETNPKLAFVPQSIRAFEIGTIFPMTQEGKELCDEFNQYIDQIRADGTLEELKDYWLYPGEWKTFDIPRSGPNGVLKFATCSSNKPFAMVLDGKYAGFDVALITGFCKANGYGLIIEDMDFAGILAGIASGKYNLAAGQIAWTAERAQSVLYSDTYCTQEMVPIVRASDFDVVAGKDESITKSSFWSSVKRSFVRTFVAQSRWRIILAGVGVTLVITFFGFLLANIFGALFCMMVLSKSKVLHIIADIYSRLMQGLPVVVILMLLYYIILGKTNLSGTAVACIGFGITSGAYLAQLFEGAIRSVDPGQWEATLALGFTKREAFFGIVFPQAFRKMLPGYFSQIISLMKGTAIVGYIAVVDLTKAGDIVRSSTYEAFFPLIAVAIIYFAFSNIILSASKLLQKKLAPKRMKSVAEGERS